MYIFIAPLRISVTQLQERIIPFLDGYQFLLVDSDGTTNSDDVRQKLDAKVPVAIFSTFESAVNVLDTVLTPEERLFVVCDESHNTVTNTDVQQFLNSFSPPSEK